MTDFPEAIGTAAEGALLARALEPARGEDEGQAREAACLNCRTPLVGPHCHSCGQKAHVHRTMGAFLHDLLHGALHFEGKIWHTLPLLAWKPGELTRRYIEGERARFVSPMALFLFSVFLMFAVFQVVGIGAPTDFEPEVAIDGVPVVEPEQRLAALREARAGMGDNNPAVAVLDVQIEALEARTSDGEGVASASPEGPEGQVVRTYSGSEFVGERLSTAETGWAFLDRGIAKWRENPSLMAYKLQANSYKFSWLLIPLSIPFVWLIFAWRRRFGAYDHAVFVTYSLSFMTLLFVVLAILGTAGGSDQLLFFGATLIPLLHIYKQLKGAYSLSRLSALWRTAVLSVFILMILLLFLNLLLLLGVMG